MRARFGGMYDTVSDCRDMYFRISSNGYYWSGIIKNVSILIGDNAKTVTIVRYIESTGEFFYYKSNGDEMNKAETIIKDFVLDE